MPGHENLFKKLNMLTGLICVIFSIIFFGWLYWLQFCIWAQHQPIAWGWSWGWSWEEGWGGRFWINPSPLRLISPRLWRLLVTFLEGCPDREHWSNPASVAGAIRPPDTPRFSQGEIICQDPQLSKSEWLEMLSKGDSALIAHRCLVAHACWWGTCFRRKELTIKTLHMLLWLGVFLLVTVTIKEPHYWQVWVIVHTCIIQS